MSTLSVEKNRWKVISFLAVTNIFPRPIFYPTKINFDKKFLAVTFSPEQKPNNGNVKKNYRIHYTIICLSGVGSLLDETHLDVVREII